MSAKKQQPRSIVPMVFIAAGVLLMLGSVGWYLISSNNPAAEPTPAPIVQQDIPYPEILRVGLGDAKAAFDLGNAIFIDTRGEPYFSQGHIPGAISITSEEVLDRLPELDPGAWIITYCT
jgi:3-mercaptopyruvate sulfurtransferase SseA